MNENEIRPDDKVPAFDQTETMRTSPYFKPAADIFEDGEKILLILDMPGVQNNDIEIKTQNNLLRITGHVNTKNTAKRLIEEYRIGNYYREFTISDIIDQENIKASLANGVLKLTLPKSEAAKPRRIEIKTN